MSSHLNKIFLFCVFFLFLIEGFGFSIDSIQAEGDVKRFVAIDFYSKFDYEVEYDISSIILLKESESIMSEVRQDIESSMDWEVLDFNNDGVSDLFVRCFLPDGGSFQGLYLSKGLSHFKYNYSQYYSGESTSVKIDSDRIIVHDFDLNIIDTGCYSVNQGVVLDVTYKNSKLSNLDSLEFLVSKNAFGNVRLGATINEKEIVLRDWRFGKKESPNILNKENTFKQFEYLQTVLNSLNFTELKDQNKTQSSESFMAKIKIYHSNGNVMEIQVYDIERLLFSKRYLLEFLLKEYMGNVFDYKSDDYPHYDW